MRPPLATYRLQFHAGFTFDDARRAVPYLRALGVSHLYASPLLAARPGSTHGYDVIDPTRLNPEIGDEAAFRALVDELRGNDMGILLDIVPNHMAASEANRWWLDVIERGRRSRHARTFDVNWHVEGLDGKLLLPVLGRPYGEVLADGELAVGYGEGKLWVHYYENRFPLNAAAVERALGTSEPTPDEIEDLNADRDRLHALLEAQPYRLAWWRLANRAAPYRRFFDVTELISLHAEDPRVFEDTHRFVVKLVARGLVDGLRIDHVDGLADPEAYLDRLARRTDGAYVVVEKILGEGEDLPETWATEGESGYGFIGVCNDLFVDPRGLQDLHEFAARFVGAPLDFDAIVLDAKRQVLAQLFEGEVAALTDRLAAIAREDLRARDLGRRDLREAIEALTVSLPVYRTYVNGPEVRAQDARVISEAAGRAAALVPHGARAALGFLTDVLSDPRDEARVAFAMRWQQLTGPVAAKGYEDTALYRYPVLVSRNEVGSHPGVAPGGVAGFHAANRARTRGTPLSASSTHDTKRSEDVRARLDVLSEIPAEWAEQVEAWRQAGARHARRGGPDATDELLLYQTIAGAYPLDERGRRDFPDRVAEYMRKAMREAKSRTSWLDPDEGYEDGVLRYARALLADRGWRARSEPFIRRISWYGALNSLSMQLLKIASPGAPDVYQGTELWSLRLVDPDNRVAVDLDERARLLADLDERSGRDRGALLAELLAEWPDGRVKLWVTWKALRARDEHAEVFAGGDYLPLEVRGPRAEHVVAFARRRRSRWAVAIAPRMVTRLAPEGAAPLGRAAWRTTAVVLPGGAPEVLQDALSGAQVRARDGALRLSDVLARFPVALLST